MARAVEFMRVEVDKLTIERLKAKFSGSHVFGNELRKVLIDVTQAGEKKVLQRVPVLTGLTRSAITSEVAPGAIPLWARVRLAGTPQRGAFRYAWALNSAKKIKGKSGSYDYRSGARTGKPTRRWFHGARPTMRRAMEKALKHLASRIESRWRQ